MYQIKSLMFTVILSAIIILTSCQKDNLTSPAPEEITPILTKIIQDNNSYTEYSYENGLISKYEYYQSGSVIKSTVLKYNSDGQVTEQDVLEPYADYKLVFEYDSNKEVKRISVLQNTGSSYEEYDYLYLKYDTFNRLVKIEEYNVYNNTMWNHSEYNYDQKGNLIEERVYQGEDPYETITYTYEDNISPLKAYRKNDLFTALCNPNNITKMIKTTYYNGIGNSTETNYTYTYNEKGYPLTRNTYSGGSSIPIVETYKYK